MADRIELHILLKELLGSDHVYYRPPENTKMVYPAIRYSKQGIDAEHADDKKYLKRNRYQLIVIAKLPDDPVIDKLLELPYCSYEQHYIADNLNHDVLRIYY